MNAIVLSYCPRANKYVAQPIATRGLLPETFNTAAAVESTCDHFPSSASFAIKLL